MYFGDNIYSKKINRKGGGRKWQISVAELMERQGKKFIANEKLSVKHPKMKNPNLALKK